MDYQCFFGNKKARARRTGAYHHKENIADYKSSLWQVPLSIVFLPRTWH